MATLIQDDEMRTLNQWIGNRVKYTLLYRISRDGCNAWTFHTKCDAKGPTVTIIYNTKDTVYGGYTSQSWQSSSGAYHAYDAKAFLFQVRKNGKSVSKKYPIKADRYGNAINNHHSYGPRFGSGDMPWFSHNVEPASGVFTLQSCTLNNTYDMKGDDISVFADNILEMRDLEVYKVDGMYKILHLLTCSTRNKKVTKMIYDFHLRVS
jgi:hypothetical protein